VRTERDGTRAPTRRSVLPADVIDVVREFRTAELATIARDGVPLAVPLSPLWQPEHDRFLVTTGIGLPYKAYHARRNPRVSLLFSSPTGSGLTDPPAVLVQGDATVSEVTTWDDDLAEFWPWILHRQPAGASAVAAPFYRYVIPWYYQRLKIWVTPRRVRWWPQPDMTADPVSSAGEPAPTTPSSTVAPAATDPDPKAYERLAGAASRYAALWLTVVDATGYPATTLCTAAPDAERRALRVQVPSWLDADPGPASVMSHRHDETLWRLAGFLSRGALLRDEQGWLFAPTAFTTLNASTPADTLRFVRDTRRSARAHLKRMSTPPPPIPWDKLAAAKKAARASAQR
jgi:hypothetical protein